MKAIYRFGVACIACLLFVTAHAENKVPKHSFKKSYDQMLAELPNVRDQLSEKDLGSGMKRWIGAVPVGTADAVIQITGNGKENITELTVLLLFTTKTNENDYENAEYLRDVLFQGLIGRKDSFDYVNGFFTQEMQRQAPIIRAGGTPKRGVKTIGYGASELSVEISPVPQGFMALYSMRLL